MMALLLDTFPVAQLGLILATGSPSGEGEVDADGGTWLLVLDEVEYGLEMKE